MCGHTDVFYSERFMRWECLRCGDNAAPPIIEPSLPLDLARRCAELARRKTTPSQTV